MSKNTEQVILGLLGLMFVACWISAFIGIAGMLSNLLPDYKSRQPPTNLLHCISRPDLLNAAGRKWRFVFPIALLLGLLVGAIALVFASYTGQLKHIQN
jgi:hypothetical protein